MCNITFPASPRLQNCWDQTTKAHTSSSAEAVPLASATGWSHAVPNDAKWALEGVPKVDTPMKSNDFFKSWSQPCSLRRIWTSVHTAFADSFERAGKSMMEFNLWESPKFDGWLSCLKIEMTILGIMCVLIPHFQAYPQLNWNWLSTAHGPDVGATPGACTARWVEVTEYWSSGVLSSASTDGTEPWPDSEIPMTGPHLQEWKSMEITAKCIFDHLCILLHPITSYYNLLPGLPSTVCVGETSWTFAASALSAFSDLAEGSWGAGRAGLSA